MNVVVIRMPWNATINVAVFVLACICNCIECVELVCSIIRQALNVIGVCICDHIIMQQVEPASHSRQIGVEGRLHSKHKSVNNKQEEDEHCC